MKKATSLLALIFAWGILGCRPLNRPTLSYDFNQAEAYRHITNQLALGPRYPNSTGHAQVRDYIATELEKAGWTVEKQRFTYQGGEGMNIIGRNDPTATTPPILVGAHYDTRARADQSRGSEATPVMGAVDGATGVAILLELARSLEKEKLSAPIWLTFFDLEDNGNNGITGWDWIVGSTYMAQQLSSLPQAMVLVDMVGQKEQTFYLEGHSDPTLQATLWQIAADLGYADQFIGQLKYTMIDDHLPFAQRGIPTTNIIDFDYAQWHTVEDTIEQISAENLYIVGHVLESWLEKHP